MKTWSRVGNDIDKISAVSWISDTFSSKSCVFNRLPFPKRLRGVLGAHKGMEKLWNYRLRFLTSEKTQQKHSKALTGRLGIPVSHPKSGPQGNVKRVKEKVIKK